MRNFKIKKSRKTRLWISLIVIFLIIALIFIYFAACVNPVIVETNLTNGATLTAQSQSVNASNQGLKDVSGELK